MNRTRYYGREHNGTDANESSRRLRRRQSYQGGRFNSSCLGEALLRSATNGAVAYIGCDTGSQPCAADVGRRFHNSARRIQASHGWATAGPVRSITITNNETLPPSSQPTIGILHQFFSNR